MESDEQANVIQNETIAQRIEKTLRTAKPELNVSVSPDLTAITNYRLNITVIRCINTIKGVFCDD